MLCYCPARGGGSRTGESWLQLLRSSSTVCNGLLVRKFIASLSLRHIAHTRTPRRTSGRRPSGHKLSIVTRDDERVLTRMLRVDTQARPAPLARLHARGTPLHSFFEVGGWSYRTRTRWQATHWRVHASRGQHCSRPPGRPKRRTGTTVHPTAPPPHPIQMARTPPHANQTRACPFSVPGWTRSPQARKPFKRLARGTQRTTMRIIVVESVGGPGARPTGCCKAQCSEGSEHPLPGHRP
jgi:hypothetical protein